VGTDFQPGTGSGFTGFLDGFPEQVGIHIQGFHLLVVFIARGVGEKFIHLFRGVDGLFVAIYSFWHACVLL
jgi:hypothetical protein